MNQAPPHASGSADLDQPWPALRASPVAAVALDGGKARMEPAETPTVVIVDDDDAVRETLVELLNMAGYRVIAAQGSAEALEAVRGEKRVDALVTDLTMPGDDGIALIRRVRDLHAGLPAILLTGYAEQTNAVATIAGGRVHVLRKPVHSSDWWTNSRCCLSAIATGNRARSGHGWAAA